jgi:hypothetical protein
MAQSYQPEESARMASAAAAKTSTACAPCRAGGLPSSATPSPRLRGSGHAPAVRSSEGFAPLRARIIPREIDLNRSGWNWLLPR